MKNRFVALAIASIMMLIGMGQANAAAAAADFSLKGCEASAAFSPQGGGKELIIDTIKGAKGSIKMAAYSFTEPAIARALLVASEAGVKVDIVVDKDHNGKKENTKLSVSGFLARNGVGVFVTDHFKIQHNKFLVIDGKTVQTGSFNYSRSAENDNAENVLVLHNCKDLATAYAKDWDKLRAVARPLTQ